MLRTFSKFLLLLSVKTAAEVECFDAVYKDTMKYTYMYISTGEIDTSLYELLLCYDAPPILISRFDTWLRSRYSKKVRLTSSQRQLNIYLQ